MKTLNFYKSRNLHTDNDIFNYLMSTFKESIFTWDYFVDFSKVKGNTKKFKTELQILNSLLGTPEIEIKAKFLKIVEQSPNVRKALPILIASRINKLQSTPIIDDLNTLNSVYKAHIFDSKTPLTKEVTDDLLSFFELSGFMKFFINQEVNNLIDYCMGIEAGMDTNARKNRTGTLMENILEKYLKNFSTRNHLTYIPQATKEDISNKLGVHIELDKIGRIFDFALYHPKNGLFLFETNYYSGGGSKLKATAGEYKSLYDLLIDQGIHFIWVTDGYGWKTSKTALFETFIHNDFLFNLQMIADGILDEIVLQEIVTNA